MLTSLPAPTQPGSRDAENPPPTALAMPGLQRPVPVCVPRRLEAPGGNRHSLNTPRNGGSPISGGAEMENECRERGSRGSRFAEVRRGLGGDLGAAGGPPEAGERRGRRQDSPGPGRCPRQAVWWRAASTRRSGCPRRRGRRRRRQPWRCALGDETPGAAYGAPQGQTSERAAPRV